MAAQSDVRKRLFSNPCAGAGAHAMSCHLFPHVDVVKGTRHAAAAVRARVGVSLDPIPHLTLNL